MGNKSKNPSPHAWTSGEDKIIEDTSNANQNLENGEVAVLAIAALVDKYGRQPHFEKLKLSPRISKIRQNKKLKNYDKRKNLKPGPAPTYLPKDYKKVVTAHFEVCLRKPKQSCAARDARVSEYKSPSTLVSFVYPQHGGPNAKPDILEALVKDGFPKDYAEMKRRADNDEDLVQLGGTVRRGSGVSSRVKVSKSNNVQDTKGNGEVKDEDEEGVDQNDGNNKRKIGGSGSDGTRKRIKKEESEDDGEWKGGKGKGKGEGKTVEREKRMKIKKESE
ncbi:hypothetical protein JCM5353_002068 [Sporobolomyces roseus]